MRAVVAVMIIAATACSKTPRISAETLLGGERGLDHVGLAVQDLAAARKTFHDTLGFGAMIPGRLPNGIQNENYYFEDSTYLETLTAWDSQKAKWLADFTAVREGPVFLALAIGSTDATAAFLAGRGVKTGAPISGTIQTAGDTGSPKELWRTMFFDGAPLPGSPLFFIAYGQPKRGEDLRKLDEARASGHIYRHPNTAVGVKAAWLAVPDLALAVKAFDDVGMKALGAFEEPRLGARGRIIEAGQGRILLVTPTTPDGAVATLLKERGKASLLGFSIEVRRLSAVQRLVLAATGQPVASQSGALGMSVFVGPTMAHGAWMEFFEAGAP
jgi:hypothetical protein